ncbi:unnamed protein product [Rotaria sordida]|uniref:Alpha/beta hydrolase fold-3 domain-containing protein n=1 Tax=Rotaria sordida TaxID=392033 RepID=A0A815EMC1_9BILA|nr:unnamed protein product [Rotaria sordida]
MFEHEKCYLVGENPTYDNLAELMFRVGDYDRRLFVLIVAIVIPLLYGSTNCRHLAIRTLHTMLALKHSLLLDEARPTLSAKYRAFEDLLRMRSIEYDPLSDPINIIKTIRSTCSMCDVIPKPSQCQINKEVFEHDEHSIDTYWIDYPMRKFQRNSDKLLLYLHGGGYLSGNINDYSGIECHLSYLFNVTILHVEYRLSPEHPLPAAVDDIVVLYCALLRDNMSPSQMMIIGDSAGGGLSLLIVQALLAHQLPVPRGVIVISPWTDLSTSGESFTRNDEIDLIFTCHDVKWIASQLLDPNKSQLSLNNPLLSPLFGSFQGFPPMYITVGTAEILEDDSRRVLKKAQAVGVNVTFEEGLHLMHVYPIFFSYFPEARNTLDNINKWIQTIFTEKHN